MEQQSNWEIVGIHSGDSCGIKISPGFVIKLCNQVPGKQINIDNDACADK